ncbi:type II secretion system minor pseudopilin GspK [Viridibacterium curvum]|uniref:Type II secretion system protein K n=2 Tax=Viridibacterium curvum TaxID=1101404 RepID=A0ABP9QCY7_9RHOO
MAILTVALVAAVASAVIAEHGSAVEQLSGRSDQAQARWLARGAVDWARNVLEFDLKRARTSGSDHFGEEWAIRVPATPVDEGDVSGEIEDQSGRFNINSLTDNGVADTATQAIFQRLLETLRWQPRDAQMLVDAITDWIDTDSNPASNGAERDWYTNAKQKVMPPNAPIISIKELLAVRGMTNELLEQLRPHITALPPSARTINVNTASAEVLAAYVEKLPLATAQQIANSRKTLVFGGVDEFTKLLPTTSSYNASLLSVRSYYFLATGRARWGDATTHMQVLLFRNGKRPDILRETLL